jgi:CIC family chloride channel protein
MEAITIGDGKLPVLQNLLRSASSLCTIASGGSIGREGSMIQLAALASSLIGRLTRFDPPRLRLLVACGAAAGITSAYNAPIAGAFFVTEIVLGSIAMESFGPILVASVIANITMREFAGYRPPYEMPPFPPIAGIEITLFVGLGVLCGVAAPLFLRLLELSRHRFGKLALALPWRLGLGGLAVGALSIWVPDVWGNGYSVVNSILHEPWTWSALLLVLVMKVLATALTTGSGAVGGVFTPTLFVGATIGCLYGLAVHGIWPHGGSAPFAYAIVGMGAFLAAATSAPLMAILMIFEMTLSYQVVLPLMLACVVAYFLARTVGETSMYEVTATRNRRLREQARLRATRMRTLIRPADTVLSLDAVVDEMTKVFLEYPVKYIYIVDGARHFKGAVALQDITSHLLAESRGYKTAADFVRPDFPVLTPDLTLGDALQLFVAFQGERLPVVETVADPVLLGVVYKSSLLDAYFRMNGAD